VRRALSPRPARDHQALAGIASISDGAIDIGLTRRNFGRPQAISFSANRRGDRGLHRLLRILFRIRACGGASGSARHEQHEKCPLQAAPELVWMTTPSEDRFD
jgi:hypothetical protein